jgi:two-component system, NarL family, response regulator NreC
MDVNLPGMDGIEATRIIHREHPEIRIIDLSMFDANKKAAVMFEAGNFKSAGASGNAIPARL